MPGIEELIMRHCPNLNDKGLRILAEGLTRLSELQVGGKTAVSLRGILRFAQLRGQQLAKLELSLPPDFSLRHLRDMLGLCPNLLDVTFHFAKETHDAAAASTIILPKSKIEKATLGQLPSVGVGPFTDSVAAQLRMLALFECHGLAFSQIKELLGKCVVLDDLRLHLCCCGGRGGVGMTAGGAAAGTDADSSSSSKSLHCLMLGFCQKVDAGAKNMARNVLELCPRVTELTLKFGRKLDPVALLTNRLPHLEQLTVFQCSLVSAPRVPKNSSTFDRLHSLTLDECMNVTDELLVVVVGLCPGLSRLSVSCGRLDAMGDSVPSFGGIPRLLAACPALTRLSMANCFSRPGVWEDDNGNLVAAEPRPKLQAVCQNRTHLCS
jgi:hypothetical protein